VQRLLVEGPSRLTRVGVDAIDEELLEGWTRGVLNLVWGYGLSVNWLSRRLAVVLRAAWDQSIQSTAKATTASH
jgi:hypothetical protein